MVAGQEASPKDVRDTERLMRYWAEGQGAIKIRWGEGGDYDRCLRALEPYVGPAMVHGLCQNLHQRALGYGTSEHAKMIKAAEGKTMAKKLDH